MPAIFLPGPFADPDLLVAILGPEGAATTRAPARLPGHALVADPRGARLALVSEAGSTAAGAVVEVAPQGQQRLGFAFVAFGAAEFPTWMETVEGIRVSVHRALGVAGPCERFRPPGEPEWRAHLAEAAEEVMGHFGARPASAMPGLMQGVSFRALSRVRGRSGTGPVGARSGLGDQDVEAVGLDRPYAQYFAIEAHRLTHRRFDGRMSPVIERAVFASGDAVTVLPFDPRRRSVLLIEQFRIGPLARRDPTPWCLEAIAGRCDAGESPEATARREAQEEAGLTLGRIERIAGYYSSPGIMCEHLTAFVGEAELDDAEGLFGLPDEDEDIRALVVSLDAALELVASGEVNNGPLLISLLWLSGAADRLCAAWGRVHGG